MSIIILFIYVCGAAEDVFLGVIKPPEEPPIHIKGPIPHGLNSKRDAAISFQFDDSVPPASVPNTAPFTYAAYIINTYLELVRPVSFGVSWTSNPSGDSKKRTTIAVPPSFSRVRGHEKGKRLAVSAVLSTAQPTLLLASDVIIARSLALQVLGGNPPGSIDAVLRFNNNASLWYAGLDGNTPVDKFDLVTAILHEMVHALGFISGVYNGGNSYYGFPGIDPTIFSADKLIVNSSNQRLVQNVETFTPPLIAPGSIVFGRYAALPTISSHTSFLDMPLYNPSSWQDGSSISHINVPSSDINALMNAFISRGDSVHTIGPLTLAFLVQMGYTPHNCTLFDGLCSSCPCSYCESTGHCFDASLQQYTCPEDPATSCTLPPPNLSPSPSSSPNITSAALRTVGELVFLGLGINMILG